MHVIVCQQGIGERAWSGHGSQTGHWIILGLRARQLSHIDTLPHGRTSGQTPFIQATFEGSNVPSDPIYRCLDLEEPTIPTA